MGPVRPAVSVSGALPGADHRHAHHRRSLAGSVQALERALSCPENEPGWAETVRVRLRHLADAFDEHVRLTEGADGLYAELLDHAPRLARGVQVMVGEHVRIATRLRGLQRRAERRAPAVEDLRRRGDRLLDLLARHWQRGGDLLHEAYGTDIGGET